MSYCVGEAGKSVVLEVPDAEKLAHKKEKEDGELTLEAGLFRWATLSIQT